MQLCTGIRSRCEIADYASVDLFEDEETHGILQIDSSNALNSINRTIVLPNMNILCPEFATYVYNCYQIPVRLLISGEKELQPTEGTTQGDPIIMGMYAIGVFYLLHLNETSNQINQRTRRLAFADDFTGSGKLQELRSWWDSILSHGLNIGYYPKASKSWLTIKEQYFDDAIKIFESTGVKIIMRGRGYLDAIVGSKEYKRQYLSEAVHNWNHEIVRLSDIAKAFPHEAYAAFVFGYQQKFTYIMRS